MVRREPIDAKIIKKVYEPEIVKHHLASVAPVVATAAPIKYYNAHQQAPDVIVAPTPIQKVFAPSAVLHHQKVKSQFIAPQQYYAPPENPKFFRPVQKIQKFFQPAHEYEPHHTDVKYASSPSQYNHY